ncbi:MAG: sel1 repeat family protein [Magnetococcales bacterium]|nr:sel1 repeat family protein [Magnetococcales bacterium]
MKKISVLELLMDQQDEEFSEAVKHYERKEYAGAREGFEKLAQRSDPQAQVNLALMLRDGHGVAADPVTAHMWLELASRSGDEVAIQERDGLQKSLLPQQVAQATQRADAWRSTL